MTTFNRLRGFMNDYHVLFRAWNHRDVDNSSLHGNRNYHMFRQVLRQSHEEYQQLHQEQFQMITDGAFVR